MYCALLVIACISLQLHADQDFTPKQQAVSVRGGKKIRDVVKVSRIRNNFLLGYGLVVGLRGTGDKNSAKSKQVLSDMLAKQGMSQEGGFETKNIAVVTVSAELPPFACSGTRITVYVASVGTATDIREGTLIATPLFGPDGNVYAVAQGQLPSGTSRTTSSRILQGAMIENLPPSKMQDGEIFLQLGAPNASLATEIACAINTRFGAKLAEAISPRCIKVAVPHQSTQQAMEFLAEVEGIELADQSTTRVVADRQNQAILVTGVDLPIDSVELTHNNVKIEIGEDVDEEEGGAIALKSTTLKQFIKVLQNARFSTDQILEILDILQERGVIGGVVIEAC